MHRAIIASALAVIVSLAAAPHAQIALISVNQEIELGRQAQQEVSSKVPRLTDRSAVSYVQSIGRRLVARAGGPRYPYSFSVANYREINAFALPGGPVWIHRGAISAARNEAQLASVVAHEVAHIAQRHAADQLTKGLVANGLIGLLGAVLGNDRSARTAQIAAQMMANGYRLQFSRDDEREADRVGATIMRRAGWDAREMIAFMEILRQQQGRDPGSVETFLSSHPAPGERAALLRSSLKGASGGRRDSSEFQQIRARLQRLPPARSMPAR
jgi:beta-barrel assembly-enhancing protease